ncbi:MAG: SufD family Fe-S cluster assembly protein [Candidatus Hydrogenedentes bacterium]|nr:SufD family Fe-S cluster assembly protein [Candidatus Hydrogenedentota bacterium]
MSGDDIVQKLLESIGITPGHPLPVNTARLQVHGNRVVGAHLVPGLLVDVDERPDGIAADITVKEGVQIERPVHICFGLLPERGAQHIEMHIDIQEGAQASVLAHCTFPNAVEIEHRMDASITVGAGASYSYFERHVHGSSGGVHVVPKAQVTLHEGARFKTEFELIKGRVGAIDIDYETECRAHSVLEMIARIGGRGDDAITIRETGRLVGAHARAVLNSHIALRDTSHAEVYNTLIASAPHARGHVDCKEVVQGQALAKAVPIVEVNDPTAHVTHEAAIGSVDAKQLETLMSRGLGEDDAVDLIIEGLLS